VDFRARYRSVVERLRSAGVSRVVLQTPPGVTPLDPDAATRGVTYPDERTREAKLRGLRVRIAWIAGYAEAVREVADACGAALVDQFAVWEDARRRNSLGQLMDGGFHPNEYGHRLLAHTLIRELGLWSEESWTCRLFVPLRS
jgi:lysophospholipase L1-like esterase